MAVDILTHVHTWQVARIPPPPPEPEQLQQQVHLAEALLGLRAAGRALSVLTVLGSKLGRELGPPQAHRQEGRWPRSASSVGQAGVVPGLGQVSDEAGGLTGTEEELRAGVQGLRVVVADCVFKAVYCAARMCMYCSGFKDPAVKRSAKGAALASVRNVKAVDSKCLDLPVGGICSMQYACAIRLC